MHRWEPSNIFNPCMTQAPVLKRSWSLWYEHWFLLSRQKKQYWYWCYISIIMKKSFSQVICWHLASFLKWGSLNLGSRPWRTKASVQPHFESEAVWIQDRGHCGRKQAFNHCVITNAKLKKCALHFVIERWFFSLFDDANFAVGPDSGFYDWYPHVTVWIENYWYWYILNNLLAKRTGKIFYVSL